MKSVIKKKLAELASGSIFYNQLLSKHTTFKIGGQAEVVIKPLNIADLKEIITYLQEKEIGCWILGNGSNLLISDSGLSGVVLILSELNELEIEGRQIRAQAGVKVPKLINQAAKEGLSGLEALAGLPASLGGAIASNAGANGVWVSDLLSTINVLTWQGKIKTFHQDDFDFSYRNSSLLADNNIIIEAILEFDQTQPSLVQERIQEKLRLRQSKQPLSKPNAGCIFKNPADDFAGRLIDESGCKGLRVGDAEVSNKHANFIINHGQASCQDVIKLIKKVETKVEEKFSVKLEREIIILGDS
ncbi:MAG: UDP-N-acetylmuramate dehydrogenase [Bacillota bacterium]